MVIYEIDFFAQVADSSLQYGEFVSHESVGLLVCGMNVHVHVGG